ncbi:Rhomboid protein 1, mitochondrial [Cytospora mali]|uniref:Rhomboid protein 1, mitochondrial n=1 Tax=Cytospora mali TaxID=578113 RepID=A0A194VQI8_CYTMA|nr:Rhomboid protein 1, mitochondrial [Valsa mali]
METVIYDETPLAEYLKDEGEEQQRDWALQEPDVIIDTPPPSPPSPSFAPTGRPLVKARFRNKIPNSLNIELPTPKKRLSSLQDGASAVATTLDRADNSKFLEQFRYTIVASQLLSGHSILGQHVPVQSSKISVGIDQDPNTPSQTGLLITAVGALGIAWFISWLYGGGYTHLTKKRVVVFVVVFAIAGVASQAYIKQQWLRYVREQTLAEITTFVSKAQDFDSITSAAVALVQEVELVSRGYRLSAPLPPISRIEDRSQTRRCVRLRKALKRSFMDIISKYEQAASVAKGFSEQLDLERYYDIYDISDLDMSDAQQGYSETEFEDMESLRTLKIAASRFHVLRKMFLCALLSMEAQGDDTDFLRWTTVVESLRMVNEGMTSAYQRLGSILGEESFPAPPPTGDRSPLSPGRERWRSQLRKLNSLTTGIRGLQAKMTLLREESDRALNEASDISELGPNLMDQYESIGADLKMLQQAWQDGKAALASGIDRNEKRLSSVSGMISPTISLGGLTTVGEESGGGVSDALLALTGEAPDSFDLNKHSGESEEIFEAVAGPPQRPRSLLTRDERIARMREERERRADMREKSDASRGMLKELEMVINLRPNKNRRQTLPPPNTNRVVSLGIIQSQQRNAIRYAEQQQRRTFFGSPGVITNYVDVPPTYKDEEGLPFRKDGDLDLATTVSIFQGFADMTPYRANKLLKILHGRRVAGTLEDPELHENTASYSSREIERGLEYLRKTVPVDEITNAGLRAEDELRELEAIMGEDADGKDAPSKKDGSHGSSGGWIYKDTGNQNVYGESVLDKIRARNIAKREAEEKALEGKRKLEEEAGQQNWGGLARYQPTGARPLQVMSPKEEEYRAQATSDLEAPPETPRWRLLLPTTVFVATLVPFLWWLSQDYSPPAEDKRLMPWTSQGNATVYGIVLLNLAVFVAWRRMSLWRFMNRWLIMDLAVPKPIGTVTAIFSHQTTRHLAENMFYLWLLGGLLLNEVNRAEYLTVFVSSGAAGFLASLYKCVLTRHLTYGLGASSATLGVICAYFWLYRFEGFKILGLPPDPYNGVQGLGVIGLIAGMNLIPAFRALPGQMDWMSHLAGIVMGIGFAELIERRRRKEREGEGKPIIGGTEEGDLKTET